LDKVEPFLQYRLVAIESKTTDVFHQEEFGTEAGRQAKEVTHKMPARIIRVRPTDFAERLAWRPAQQAVDVPARPRNDRRDIEC
jgi:hypothetical protein